MVASASAAGDDPSHGRRVSAIMAEEHHSQGRVAPRGKGWARMRGVSRFKALRFRGEEGGFVHGMWARMQGATNRAMGLVRLTPRQVAPPAGKTNGTAGSSNRLMAVTRMASLQESSRKKEEAETLRKKPRTRMLLAIEKPNSSFNLVMIGTVSLSVLLFMLETEAAVVCQIGRTGRNVWFGVEALCIALFTGEILARLGLVMTEPELSCKARAKGTLRMLCQPMTLVDVIALVPFYTGTGPNP